MENKLKKVTNRVVSQELGPEPKKLHKRMFVKLKFTYACLSKATQVGPQEIF